MVIPSSVPVFIQDVEVADNKQYSKAKLKIFYIGETRDHRLFTKDFSDKILLTLPNTPIVAFWDKQKQDFRGHHSEQFIYGVVPENGTIEYVKDEESGNTFAVTDVILYTERTDNIGEVAKKIVGKQHSLELKPDTLKYKINRDNSGRFMNIQFIDGCFIGLSVLGDDETPAFDGAGFFDVDDFAAFTDKCAANFVEFLTSLNNHGGKITVFDREEYFNKVKNSAFTKTMQAFQDDIYSCLDSLGVYGWIVENTTDYAIISTWNETENRSMLVKYTIVNGDGQMSLTNPIECVVKYVVKDDNASNATVVEPSFAEDDKKKKKPEEEDTETPDTTESDKDEEPDTDDTVEDDDDEKKKKKPNEYTAGEDTSSNQTEGVADATVTEIGKAEEQVTTTAAGACTSTLSDTERQELETYRRNEKLKAIAEYDGDIDAAILEEFKTSVDSYSLDELNAALALKFRAAIKTRENTTDATNFNKNPTNFSMLTPAPTYDPNNVADVVNKYNKR